MSDKRHHRGPDPEDERLFAPHACAALRSATGDLCWLLNRGYATASALELVGNRYALTRRQRMAVGRCACADEDLRHRKEHEVQPSQLKAQELWLDGYNVLTTIEVAAKEGWDWQVETAFNPDKVLVQSEQIVATSDSAILDRCGRWINLTRLVIDRHVAHAHVVDLCLTAADKPTGQ
jgi:hypothetical protein